MKVKQNKGAASEQPAKTRVLERLIAQTRVIRKSNDLAEVEEATEWEKQLQQRLSELRRQTAVAA